MSSKTVNIPMTASQRSVFFAGAWIRFNITMLHDQHSVENTVKEYCEDLSYSNFKGRLHFILNRGCVHL